MVTSLFNHERIVTTDSKAKELRSVAEKMITLGKRGDLHAQRMAASYIRDKKIVTKLFSTIAPRYQERNGGYTRIIKLGARLGDNAELSVLELVEEQIKSAAEKNPAKKAAAKKPAAAKTVAAKAKKEAVDVPKSKVADSAEECEAAAD
jgi:large subunit ribosomal protein L17